MFKNLSGKTLLQHHRVFRKALDYAYKMQLIGKNPADLLEAPRAKKYKAAALDAKQAKTLLNVIQNTRLEVPIHIAIACGLRRGEILGLRWNDIDFNNGTITINQNLVRAGLELVFKEPKTEKSKRTIPAPTQLMLLLREHKKKQIELQLRSYGEWNNERNLVCINSNGEPINPATFSHAFGDFLKRNNLPSIRLHDLRHTYATLMLLAKTETKIVSELLGHSTIGITADLYTHVLKDMKQEAAEKLSNELYK
jgi:integrase